jgi:WD40 repeat protein
VAFRAGGTRLATAGADGAVRLWAVDSGLEVLSLRGHEGAVTSLAFGAQGRLLVTGGEDQTVRIWEGRGAGNDE